MPAASLLTLIDDVASVLDDVAVMTKLAAKKTAGVLGDDLALNAQQVTGVAADRELPVVLAVAKGSALNKAILVPAALAISALAPWAVTPLLMAGGGFLCFEGFEKLAHKFLHGDEARHRELALELADPNVDVVAAEKEKIKGAVRTDFVLSAEIIAITLGVVATAPFLSRLTVLTGIAIIMTVGVYGLVAGIVKLDDLGLFLGSKKGDSAPARLQRKAGEAILSAAPYLMKTLSVVGTVAMFLVGGGILTHGIAPLHHAIESVALWAGGVPLLGRALEALMPAALDASIGVAAGAAALGGVSLVKRLATTAQSPART
jgi:uncharacterized protein